MIKIFDTHGHPHLNKVKDKEKVIEDFFKKGGKYINIIGTNKETIIETLKIANKYEHVFVSIGIHPSDTYDLDLLETINFLEEILKKNRSKIIGIGECGLDYYWLEKDENKPLSGILSPSQEKEVTNAKIQKIEIQKLFFKAQIKLAKEYNLPLIIHNRESKDDVFDILKQSGYKNFIYHCYSEDSDYAQKLLDFAPDCKISFSGTVTFTNAKEIQEAAKIVPIKNILAETDCPYLTPTPLRGKEENEPFFTKYVIEKISELKGKDCSNEIYENSKKTFGIK